MALRKAFLYLTFIFFIITVLLRITTKMLGVEQPDYSDKKVLTAANKHPLVDSMNFFDRNKEFCEDVLNDWSSFKLDPSYNKLLPLLEKAIRLYEKGDGEGHSGQLMIETKLFHHIARQPSVKTICETGFNLGHSSFNWLSANPKTKVYSFDLGIHPFVLPMNKTIHEIFPDKRHTLILGDSTITVPKAIEENVLPLCDVALVDGGHTYPIARSDIAYFANHMTEDNLLLFDDHPTSWGTGFGQAWDERKYGPTLGLKTPINYEKIKGELREREKTPTSNSLDSLNRRFTIVELLRCKIRSEMKKLPRGFVVGTVIRI